MLSPVASCLPSTTSSQQNTWINGITLLDRDRVKLQVKRGNAFWQILVALVIPRYYDLSDGLMFIRQYTSLFLVIDSSLLFNIFFQSLIPPGQITGTYEKPCINADVCQLRGTPWEWLTYFSPSPWPKQSWCPSTRFKFLLKFISEGDRLSRSLVELYS